MSQATFFRCQPAPDARARQGCCRARQAGRVIDDSSSRRKRQASRSMSGPMSGSTLYDTVLLLSIVAAIVAGVWLLWRI
jgi:hypothetical protein